MRVLTLMSFAEDDRCEAFVCHERLEIIGRIVERGAPGRE